MIRSYNKFKFLLVTLIIILASILFWVLVSDEQSAEDPNDFHSIKEIELNAIIDSVQDGLTIAQEYALELRNDAILTKITILSKGKDDIEKRSGRITYYFEVQHESEVNHGGIISVVVDTESNSIQSLSAVYDGDDKSRKVNELYFSDFQTKINEVYEVGIKTIGSENIYDAKEPVVRVVLDSNDVSFESGEYENQVFKVSHRETLDIDSYNVISSENLE